VPALINVSSGAVADMNLTMDMQSAYTKGTMAYHLFVHERLVVGEKDLFSPIKSSGLKTFKEKSKTANNSRQTQEAVKEYKQLLAKILLLAKHREIDLREVLSYSLISPPPCFSDPSGNRATADKSSLLQAFQNFFYDMSSRKIHSGCAVIFDAMAEIQKIADYVPPTFGELATNLLNSIVKKTLDCGGTRADFVCDRYIHSSIKQQERMRRNKNKTQPQHTRALFSAQKTPAQFRRFLSCDKNKESLAEYIFAEWSSIHPSLLKNVTIYISHGEQCHSISTSADGNSVVVLKVDNLTSDIEEADSDYCNSLLAGCPKYLLSKLQKVQNNAARLILRIPRSAHVTPSLHSLHWLPVDSRIEYKLSLLCFKIISDQAPVYLSDLLHLYTPSRQLRSSADTRVFKIPSFRTKSSGQRSFSYQAPTTWNQLPVSVRHASSVSSFKSSLKTYLFSQTFSSVPLP
jgi:hypothetical protein